MSKLTDAADVRIGVSAAVHLVLDALDRGEPGWRQLSLDGVQREIEIESTQIEQMAKAAVGAGVDEAAAQAAFMVSMRSQSAVRMVALMLHLVERAHVAGAAAAGVAK